MRKIQISPSVLIASCSIVLLSGADPVVSHNSISYELSKSSRVSLAIYDKRGRLVRTLLTGAPKAQGNHIITWDGLDRYGVAQTPGEYTWKMLATEGLRAEFITQVGQNVDPPWERSTGNHEPPIGISIDHTGLYRVGATNEGAHYAVKTDLNGRHLWTCDRLSKDPKAGGTIAVTLVNDRVFELLSNGDVYGYYSSTGKVFTKADTDPNPWDLCWTPSIPPKMSNDKELLRKYRTDQAPTDLAADSLNGFIVAAYPQHGAISWFDSKDGKLVDKATGFDKLAGIACTKKGVVLAIQDGAVVSFTREKKKPQLVIPCTQLESAWRLCATPSGEEIYVAENSFMFPGSKPHHQVKKFTSEGKLIQVFGNPEGRIDGEYIATNFRGITDIEADAVGGFVITEGRHCPPRRSARFDSTGRLVREWYGAQHYGVIACPEPSDPRYVWTFANAPKPGLVRWDVDYKAKTWRVAEVYQDAFAANPFATTPAVPHVFEYDNKIYIQGGAIEPRGLSLALYDRSTKRLRPCAASGSRDNSQVYFWNDLNDDGLASDDEVKWLKRNKIGGWVSDRDFTIRTTPAASDYSPGVVLTPSRFTKGGTPVYDAANQQKSEPWVEDNRPFFPSDYRDAKDGSRFACFSAALSNPNESHECHGVWYFNSNSAIDRLVKWDKNGHQLWSVGRHSPDLDHVTGSTAMARGLVGLVHNCVIWGDASDEETARPTVWTEDGLYVDELLRVPIDSIPKEAYGLYNANEYPCGRLHEDPKSGEVLFFAINSGGGAPIYRITGWNNWLHRSGKLLLPVANNSVAKQEGTGLVGEYFNTPNCSGEPALVRTDKVVCFNWGKNAPDPRLTGDTFSVRWTGAFESATNEEIRFEVRGNFFWRSPGRPVWTKLWLGNNLVIDSREEKNSIVIQMKAGEKIEIKLECGFNKGNAAISLNSDTPGIDRRVILTKFLYPAVHEHKTNNADVVLEKREKVLARFSFDSNEGALVWSSSGNDIFGRLTGRTRSVPGKIGSAIELISNGEFAPALFPIDEELRLPDTNYSVSFWFKTTVSNIKLCETKRYSSYNNIWSDHIISINNGKLGFLLSGTNPLQAEDATANDGKWHHVITSVGSTGTRLFVDGKLQSVGKLTRRVRSSNRLGLDLGPGRGVGAVAFDELVVISNETKNEGDAKILYSTTSSLPSK